MKRITLTCIFLVFAGLISMPTSALAQSGPTPIQQLFMMKELKPGLKKIGVIWDSRDASKQTLLKELQKAGTASGVQVFVAEAFNPAAVADAYRTLLSTNKVEALWVLGTGGAANDATSRKFLVTNAGKSKVPVLAPTSDWVKEGALASVQTDGKNTVLVLNKAVAAAMAISVPEKHAAITRYL